MEMKKVDFNGFWRIDNNPISKVGIYPYLGKQISPELEPDKIYMVYRPAEELFSDEAIESFNQNPVPLINDHTMIGAQFTAPEKKGIDGVINNFHRNGDVLVGDISIFSEDMKANIEAGKKELSMGYFCNYDLTPGTYKGQHYDAIQRDIRSNHVALVDHGRMGSDVRVYDSFCFDAMDAEFEENKHPRSKDGKFTKKGMGEAGTPKANKNSLSQTNENRKSIVERARKIGEYNRSSFNSEDSEDAYKKFLHKENGFFNYGHRAAIQHYTDEGYKQINGHLRGTKRISDWDLKGVEHSIENLTDACNHQFHYDQVLYRGTGYKELSKMLSPELRKKLKTDGVNADELSKDLVGKTYSAKGFTSTTANDRGFSIAGDTEVEFKIIAPAGTRGIDLTFDSAHGGSIDNSEQEILLQRDTKFEITNVTENDDGFLQVEMAVVTPENYEKPKFDKEAFKSEIENAKQKEFLILKEWADNIPLDKVDKNSIISTMALSKLFADLEDEGKFKDPTFKQSVYKELMEKWENDDIYNAKYFFKPYAEKYYQTKLGKKDDFSERLDKIEKNFNPNSTDLDNILEQYQIIVDAEKYISSQQIEDIEDHVFKRFNATRENFKYEYNKWRSHYAV